MLTLVLHMQHIALKNIATNDAIRSRNTRPDLARKVKCTYRQLNASCARAHSGARCLLFLQWLNTTWSGARTGPEQVCDACLLSLSPTLHICSAPLSHVLASSPFLLYTSRRISVIYATVVMKVLHWFQGTLKATNKLVSTERCLNC